MIGKLNALMMEAVSNLEKSVSFYHNARRMPENSPSSNIIGVEMDDNKVSMLTTRMDQSL
jgi:hypothetical protein